MDFITSLFPWITNGPLVLVQVMSGLSVGMFLFLVSVGMSLIFGVTRIVNLAHGSFYMVSAYLMVTLIEVMPEHPVSFWIALLLAPVGVGILGGVIEVTLLRRIYRRDPMMQLILTFGLILVIGTLVLLVWGPDNKSVPRPDALAGSVRIFGQPFPSYYLLVLGLSPLVAVGLWLLFYRTRWGMLVRAATVDREMLGALGVDVSKLYTEVFVFGSWLAGLGGALAAPTVAVALGMDGDVLINAFVVVVIGGLGSFAGSLISALLVGELQSFGILIFPAVSIVLLFAIMAVVLIVRPWGLLGHPEE
ncbi:MAG TPA: branched-chain amino acid ABC transporter permease [Methylomirabilota bacterium]|jgi:branched-chain amino acid transport system permease protein|nr:branched-chain amino acid ABC transporter permease [Methylomirabilota bacterium]